MINLYFPTNLFLREHPDYRSYHGEKEKGVRLSIQEGETGVDDRRTGGISAFTNPGLPHCPGREKDVPTLAVNSR